MFLPVYGQRVVDFTVFVGIEVFPFDGFLYQEYIALGIERGEVALAHALLVDEAHVAEGAVFGVVEKRLEEELAGELLGVERHGGDGWVRARFRGACRI